MRNAPPETTQQARRSDAPAESRRTAPFLVRALECADPRSGGSRHALAQIDEVFVGRGKRSALRRVEGGRHVLQLLVPDETISSRHARIGRRGTGFVLEDLGSRNGTLVDGCAVEEIELADGALVELGSTLFLFREGRADAALVPDKMLAQSRKVLLDTLNTDFEHALARLRLVAPSSISILLFGETGAGKEVLAEDIHARSGRPGQLVAVNCGAIPAPLVEAQLFGHTRGAFTGATQDEPGFVRSADRGTLFLDEIADLPLSSQAALLRLLQSRELTPVGSSKSVRVDVRVIAATHGNLEAMVEQGAFRRDLYARLAGFVQTLPALRERREDLGLLVGTLLERLGHGAPARLEVDAARALFAYDFPLNVRELEQALSAALVLAGGAPLAPSHLPDAIRKNRALLKRMTVSDSPSAQPLSAEEAATYEALVSALRDTGGNVSEAARLMGKARQQVQRWARRFGVTPAQFKKP
jgi:DNA-binding NtrC family response regulator